MFEALLLQILGNSPVLAAVLLINARFDKRCALIEAEIEHLKEGGKNGYKKR